MDIVEKIINAYMEGIHYGRSVDYRAVIEEMYWAIKKNEISPIIPSGCNLSEVMDAWDGCVNIDEDDEDVEE